MNIKAICTDIDGTLLNADRQLSVRTIATIRDVGRRMPVILASSRMPSAMFHLQRELGIEQHPVICYNGGYVLYTDDHGKMQVFDSVTIPPEVMASIVDLSGGMNVHVSLYRDNEWFAPGFDQWTEREQRITKVNATLEGNRSVIGRWIANGHGGHKVMCMGPEEEIRQLQQSLEERCGNDVHIYLSRPTYLEIAPIAISKGSALRDILSVRYQIAMEEVLAFGDNYNDIDMLQAVGMGVAVANSRPEVIAIAREITAKSVDDGVAMTIEKYCR
jgi:Cof subfamily protein (haloacid dehalogenase superfamily)